MDPAFDQGHNFSLDPARLPQRIEIELPDAVIEAVSRQAERSNRTFNEMVQHLLA